MAKTTSPHTSFSCFLLFTNTLLNAGRRRGETPKSGDELARIRRAAPVFFHRPVNQKRELFAFWRYKSFAFRSADIEFRPAQK